MTPPWPSWPVFLLRWSVLPSSVLGQMNPSPLWKYSHHYSIGTAFSSAGQLWTLALLSLTVLMWCFIHDKDIVGWTSELAATWRFYNSLVGSSLSIWHIDICIVQVMSMQGNVKDMIQRVGIILINQWCYLVDPHQETRNWTLSHMRQYETTRFVKCFESQNICCWLTLFWYSEHVSIWSQIMNIDEIWLILCKTKM